MIASRNRVKAGMFIGWFIILASYLISSYSAHAAGLFGNDCPQAKENKTPAWVKAGFTFQKKGYRYGFGEARFTSKSNYQQQLKQAEQLARQDLVNGVHIIIDASSGISTLIESTQAGEQIKSLAQNQVQTHSKLELPGLAIYQQWQNADTCTVYVQVRISEPMVALVLQRTQAQIYFKYANNDSNPLRKRLTAIDEAIRLAKKYDFNVITAGLSSSQILSEFSDLQRDLQRLLSLNNHVIYVINDTHAVDTNALAPLRTRFKSAMPGSFETDENCSTPAICLHQAGGSNANYSTIVKVSMNSSKQNGFWVGDFVIEISLWDLANNNRL